MKIAYRYDDQGFYIEDVIVDPNNVYKTMDGQTFPDASEALMHQQTLKGTTDIDLSELEVDEEYVLPDSCTWTELPQPNYKPKWDGTQWQETGEAPAPQEPDPSETDKIRQTVADLTQQLILNGVI